MTHASTATAATSTAPAPARRYGIVANTLYALRWLSKVCGPGALALCAADTVLAVAQPFLAAALPSLVVAALTSGSSPVLVLAVIAAYVAVAQGLATLAVWTRSRRRRHCMNLRIWGGLDLCRLVLAADFHLVESDDGRRRIDDAERSFYYSNDVGIEALVVSTFDALAALLGLVAYGAVVGLSSPALLALIVVLSALSVAGNVRASEHAFSLRDESSRAYSAFSYLRRQTLDAANGKDIRLYRMRSWFARAFREATGRILGIFDSERSGYERAGLLAATLSLVRDAAAYAYLIWRLLSGVLDLPGFLLLAGMVSGVGSWMGQFFDALSQVTQNARTLTLWRELEDEWAPTAEAGTSAPNPGRPHEFRLEHVCFSYDGGTDVLHDLTLTLRAGEKVALVGVNGAGKTTLVKLLCGLYRPTSGTIYLDGVDMNGISRTALWRELSVVFQDCFPFSFTVEDNVTCAAVAGDVEKDPDVEKDARADAPSAVDPVRLTRSLDQAGLLERVRALPHGARTYLGQDVDPEGVDLSGGEVQRLMLARALYKDAPVVLLDEPTAALDPLAERQMYGRYDELAHGKTSVFISHRLSSTRFCERILFLDGGRVVEEGTHDELMAAGGAYAHMFETQARYYEDDPEGNRAPLGQEGGEGNGR